MSVPAHGPSAEAQGEAFWEGRRAYVKTEGRRPDCPYDGRTVLGRAWLNGWRAEQRDAQATKEAS